MRAGLLLFLAVAVAFPLRAIEFLTNAGQLPATYSYFARSRGVELFARGDGDVTLHSRATGGAGEVTLGWLGANAGEWLAERPTGREVRYCGARAARASCLAGSPTYGSLRRANLYGGVDLILHSAGERLEYDLEVRPGGRVEDIRFALRGGPAPVLDASGRVVAGDIVQWRPVAYQVIDGVRRTVECAVRRIAEREFAFAVGPAYRPDLPLVIDPVIESGVVLAGSELGEDRVLGREAGQVFGVSKRVGSADWDVFVTAGSVTTYWGGEGEEQILGSDFEANNGILTLVGSTSSPEAFTTGALGRGTAFHGGASDAFFLEFQRGQLMQAALLGGPGADRLHDVRRTAAVGYSGDYLIAGETDDPNWAGFQVEGEARGSSDAVAGWFGVSTAALVVTGGTGADRAKRIRLVDGKTGTWVVAGETESSDFAGKTRPGRDLWVARLTEAPLRLGPVRVWGGAGEDSLGGVAVVAGHGVMLAGTTGSPDLPGAGNSAFQGGATDGFVALLDPVDFAPLKARYLGGAGSDEITGITAWRNDLFLVGFTDSTALGLGELLPGSEPAGGQDGLFVQTDAFLNPLVAYRAGGSGDDRFTAVVPKDWGKVELTGWSESRAWLAGLEPFAAPGDGAAGFGMTLRYAMLGAAPVDPFGDAQLPPALSLGRDMQLQLPVFVANEPGSDGVVVARSMDPPKLRIGGEPAALLYRTDREVSAGVLVLEALGEEGEVEVVIGGRSPSEGAARYPERRVRVRLTPSRLFVQPPPGGVVTVARGSSFDVEVVLAQLLPDGRAGTRRWPRAGVTVSPTLVAADGGLVAADGVYAAEEGGYRVRMLALREGTPMLTLQSTGVAPAPGQQVQVRILGSALPQVSMWSSRLAVLVDHSISLSFSLAAGDRLQLRPESPERVSISIPGVAEGETLSVVGPGSYQLVLSALAGGAAAGVRVEGTVQGEAVNARMEVLPQPYSVRVSNFFGTVLAPGSEGAVTLQVSPLAAPPRDYGTGFQYIRPESALGQTRLRVSDASVLIPTWRTVDGLMIRLGFQAVQVGSARVMVDHESVAASYGVEVAGPTVSFGEEIRVPWGAAIYLATSSLYLTPESARLVRVRVSDPELFELEWASEKGADLTVDLTQRYSLLLSAKGPAGRGGSLLVSAPGMAEIAIPIRVMERALVPFQREQRWRFDPGAAEVRGTLTFLYSGYDPTVNVTSGSRFVQAFLSRLSPQRFRVRAEPAGVCVFPAELEISSSAIEIPVVCRSEGRVRVVLEGEGLTRDQGKFDVQMTVYRPAAAAVYEGVRLSLGAGMQTELPLQSASRRFSGVWTSSDPERVRVSRTAEQPGSGRIEVTRESQVFVQAYGSDGMVWLTGEGADGSREEVPVFLHPATMAVRQEREPNVRQIRIAADGTTLGAVVSAVAFERGSGLLLDIPFGATLRAGADPFFVQPVSSDAAVVSAVPPNPLFNEGDRQRPVSFRINGKGSAELTVQQPPGFFASPYAGLRVTVAERELRLQLPAVAPGLQTVASVRIVDFAAGAGGSGVSGAGLGPVTITSLDPAKLVVSASRTELGGASLVTRVDVPVYVQVLETAKPGERLRVRVSGTGFGESIAEVPVSAAELHWQGAGAALTLQPGYDAFVSVRLGPVSALEPGRLDSQWAGGLLPGRAMRVSLRAADPALIGIVTPEVELDGDTIGRWTLRSARPGATVLAVSAPDGVVNRTGPLAVRVKLWEFSLPGSTLEGARGLWAPLVLRNPREEPTAMTLDSFGAVLVGFGSTTTATPSATMTIEVPARGQTTVYWTALGRGTRATFRLTATDFTAQEYTLSTMEPQVGFQPAGPLTLAVSARTVTVSVRLLGRSELPLATGPIAVAVTSSDPRVARVVTSEVAFKTGQSTASVTVEILAAGSAILTAAPPAAFSAAGQTGVNTLSVVVR